MESAQHIIHFYGWWELVTCSFAFLGLLSIWYHLGKKKGDVGQVWLALSVLCWAISGGVEIYFSGTGNPLQDNFYLSGWRSILSLFNSLFILLSLPWFKHKPGWMKSIIESSSWYIIIAVPFLFALFPTLSRMFTGSTNHIIAELDVYFAVFTLIALVFILWESFSKRGLKLLGYLSVIFVLVTLVAQLYKFTDAIQTLILYSAIFKSLLIMIFFALALSWVKDLSEVLQIKSDDIYLTLTRNKNEKGNYQNLVSLSGITDQFAKEFTITKANNELLLKFIKTREKDPSDGWLEIMPRSDTRNIDYPIKDHKEIERLIKALLDGVFGKDLWDKGRHAVPFKEAFFESPKTKTRHIRLKPPVQNITFLTH